MSKLTHFNSKNEAHMVNVTDKPVSHRVATAAGRIAMQAKTLTLIMEAGHKKGDVLSIARIAGIMAAKKTAELVPLCHPVAISGIDIELSTDAQNSVVHCRARVESIDQTGVEMEALTAVQVCLLTVYDICKSVDRGMIIEGVQLLEKSGGQSGTWRRT